MCCCSDLELVVAYAPVQLKCSASRWLQDVSWAEVAPYVKCIRKGENFELAVPVPFPPPLMDIHGVLSWASLIQLEKQ
ncbi:hypothetical protein J6590_040602 [Homalodisca vitripennis]|nr:hypothetical protein J6590_040602 [Homalodisca vitripennis]